MVAAGPSPVKSKRGNAGDKANAEVMFAILHNLQRLMLDRKPHIKAYKKARKLQGEILGSMMAYYESGKFERKFDTNGSQRNGTNTKDRKNILSLDTEFDLDTNEGEQAFFEFMFYKVAPNMNCITEDFIQQKRYRKPEKLEFLQSMLDSRAGLFMVTDVDIGEGYVFVEEVFTGARYKVIDIALSISQNYKNSYFYNRIITYRGMSFNSGLCMVFAKDDPFITEYIQKEKKDYKPHAELVRFIELHTQFVNDPKGIKVSINDVK